MRALSALHGAETGFKPSILPPRGSEDPRVIGRESYLLKFDWLHLLARSAQIVMN